MSCFPSPFLDPGTHSAPDQLGILLLKRDHLIPAVLSSSRDRDADYAEGKVENTRFGSYPHSTLLHQPWGTQILASVVDTGSRSSRSKKRKREVEDEGGQTPAHETDDGARDTPPKAATAASSGFAHLLPPTPEIWTLCLPHRTQVVYTPDYSYVLQRLKVRPGHHLIEAGAGSGSFTHAAVRAVFNGYPEAGSTSTERPKRGGHVYSFEFHQKRAGQLQHEIKEHALSSSVTITHRDVYQDGFCIPASSTSTPTSISYPAPDADAIFLDLPAPWLALKHLTRSTLSTAVLNSVAQVSDSTTPADATDANPTPPPAPFQSPLNPKTAVRICTFSPCIEQVSKTVSALRSLGWLEIDMVEILSKRLEVRRERIGLQEEGLRGANSSAATVEEAVQRLRDVEDRAKIFHGLQKEKQERIMRKAEAKKRGEKIVPEKGDEEGEGAKEKAGGFPPSKQDRLDQAKRDLANREIFKEGRLVHRTEPELKTHTSYLVFAVLPREWSNEDEDRARRKWDK